MYSFNMIFYFFIYTHIDLINATGTIKEVMQIILKEFEYQSSLELDSETFDHLAHIPVATQIGIHARQDLISRLEHYQETESDMFHEAIKFIDSEVMPLVNRHSISGHANFRRYINIQDNRIIKIKTKKRKGKEKGIKKLN